MPTNLLPLLQKPKRVILFVMAGLLLANTLSAQGLTGLWVGNLHNDSASIRKDQSFEIALTEYRGKVYGYSRSEFIVNDTLYYILKRVKGTIKGDVCEVTDDEIMAYNFRGKLDKGVKVTSTFRRNKNDSTWYLDGNWKTNATKKYYSISGKLALEEEKDLMASKIFPHLEELNVAESVAFYKEQKELNEYKPVMRLVKSERIRTEYTAGSSIPELNATQDPVIREPNLARADITVPPTPIPTNASSVTDSASTTANARKAQPVAGLNQQSDARPENPVSSVSPVALSNTNNAVSPIKAVEPLTNTGTPIARNSKEPSSVNAPAAIPVAEPNKQTHGQQDGLVATASPVVNEKTNSNVPAGTFDEPLPGKLAANPGTHPDSSLVMNPAAKPVSEPNKQTHGQQDGLVASLSPVVKEKINSKVLTATVAEPLPDKLAANSGNHHDSLLVMNPAVKSVSETNKQANGQPEGPVSGVSPVVSEKINNSVPLGTVTGSLPNRAADPVKSSQENQLVHKQENKRSPAVIPDVKAENANRRNQPVPAQPVAENRKAGQPKQVVGSVPQQNGSSVSNTHVAVNKQQPGVEKQPAIGSENPLVNQTNKATANKQTVPLAVNTESAAAKNIQGIGLADAKKQADRPAVSPVQASQSISEIPVTRSPTINMMERSAVISGRRSEFSQEVQFVSDSLELALYDNGEIDGDTVSVYLNGEMLMGHQGLKSSAIKKTISVPRDQASFTIVMFAESLGTRPPNTGLLVVHDGEETYYVRFSSDFQKSTGIVFRRKNP